jgi:hypothetical protein
MSDYPWFKFYPRDWRGNQGLRVVSLAARGLWLEMLAIMHEGQPYARLAVNGKPVPSETLALMVGASHEEVCRLLEELRSAAVFQTTRNGVVHSARMAKERARSEKGRKSADKRWSQASVETEEIPAPTGLLNAKRPEVRSKKANIREEPVGSSSGQRLPWNWRLSSEQREWTHERFPDVTNPAIDLELERFASYWTARDDAGAIKRDWDAAWRVWAIDRWQPTVGVTRQQSRETVRLHRHLDRELFEACECLQMRAAPSDEWRFPLEVVRQAHRELGRPPMSPKVAN